MVTLSPAAAENWRDLIRVRAAQDQREWVAETAHYLCLSAYDGLWHSCAVEADGEVVGHVMWAVDPADGSHWIGGLVIDAAHQRRGHGRATVEALLARWQGEAAALSVSPDNLAALALYSSLGFTRTGEVEDDEVVLRRPPA